MKHPRGSCVFPGKGGGRDRRAKEDRLAHGQAMARLLALALTLLLFAGCLGTGNQRVHLPPVDGADAGGRGRETVQSPPPATTHGSDSDAVGPPDCTTETVQAGSTLIARIHCNKGSGSAEASLAGCAPSDSPSWLTVETQEGRLARGNATAAVSADGKSLAALSVDAAREDGKEAMVDAASGYTLTLDLDAWTGEWLTASVECAA